MPSFNTNADVGKLAARVFIFSKDERYGKWFYKGCIQEA